MPKLTRTHIILIVGVAMVLITYNAMIRVRYFGAKEREYWLSLDASSDGSGSETGP